MMSGRGVLLFCVVPLVAGLLCGCRTSPPAEPKVLYTTTTPGTDLSKPRVAWVDNDSDPALPLRGSISAAVLGMGWRVVGTRGGANAPDVIVTASYSKHKQRAGFHLLRMLDNFTITLTDSKSGEIVLTACYPRPVPLTKASWVVQQLFDDIRRRAAFDRAGAMAGGAPETK